MDKQEKENYIKSHNQWRESQELLIEMIKEQFRNSEAMVKLHQKQADLSLESLNHETGALQLSVDNFEKWKEENRAKIPNVETDQTQEL